MKIYRPSDVLSFQEQVRELLLEREAENNLMLGITSILSARDAKPGEQRFFWTAVENNRVAAAALWTPPFKPVITRMGPGAVEAMLDDMGTVDPPLNGVSGPEETALAFASGWQRRTGRGTRNVMGMIVQSLEKVEDLPPVEGSFQMARVSDIPWLTDWVSGFHEAIGLGEPVENRRILDEYVNDKRLFYWQRSGRPVSMAGFTGPTPNGIRVNLVFTPPDERNRGYARACVSSLSRYLLNKGRRSCFLFSDRKNPASNRVYERIGYVPVCNWNLFEFSA